MLPKNLIRSFPAVTVCVFLALCVTAECAAGQFSLPNLTLYDTGGTFTVPGTAVVGTPIFVSVPVLNNGAGNAGLFSVRYFLSRDLTPQTKVGDSRFTSGLSSNFFAQANFSGDCPNVAPGMYNLIFSIDFFDEIFETNENDNLFYYSPAQIEVRAPNLTLDQNVSITIPGSATAGTNMTVSSRVINTGDGAAGASSVRYYLAPDATNGPFTLLGSAPLNGIAPKAGVAASFTGPCPNVASGNYYLVWDIDALDQVVESDETDNSWNSIGTIAVTSSGGGGGTVNLAVDYSVPVTLPETAAAGKPITISTGVVNTGGSAAGSFAVTYYLTPFPVANPPSFLAVGDAIVNGIPAGGSALATFTGNCPNVPAGKYVLILLIDSQSQITESDENDNSDSSTTQVTVRAGPTDIALSKNIITEGNAIGDAVGTFSSTDPNGDSVFTYTLDAGAGETDNAFFSIAGNKLKAAAVFDFNAKNSYSIRATSTSEDGQSISKSFTIFIQPVPNSGASDVKNIGDGATVVNPLDALTIKVVSSNGGVITLSLEIDAKGRTLTALTTFEDVNGHTSVISGFSPAHKYTSAGVYVVDCTVIQDPDGTVVAHGRKTLTVGASEVGLVTPLTIAARDYTRASGNAASTAVVPRSVKGKFIFVVRGGKADSVQFSGTIKLPPGYDPAQPNTFSLGIGNIVVDSHLDKKGKAIPENSQLHGKNAPAVKSMKVTSKIKKGKVATGTEEATVTVNLSLAGLLSGGFDTEGIATRAQDLDAKKTASRNIQVSMNLSGAPYETLAPVIFAVSRDSSFGTIQGRR